MIITVDPSQDVERIIEQAQAGTTIRFSAGTYKDIQAKIVADDIHLFGDGNVDMHKARFDFRGDNGLVKGFIFHGDCSVNALFESDRDGRRQGTGLMIVNNIFKDHTGYAKRIRVGSNSRHAVISAHCTIAKNIFDNIQGEGNTGKPGGEIISVKAANCTLAHNRFNDCVGYLSIRGGQGSTVIDNAFYNSTGIQVYDENHMICSNLIGENSHIRIGDGDARDTRDTRRGRNHIAATFAQVVDNIGGGRIVIQKRYRRYRPMNVHLADNNDLDIDDQWS